MHALHIESLLTKAKENSYIHSFTSGIIVFIATGYTLAKRGERETLKRERG
jgi:hypothetical protein